MKSHTTMLTLILLLFTFPLVRRYIAYISDMADIYV